MNLLKLKSNNQKQLFNFENFFLNIINLYDNKKLPNKIIFSGPKGTGKATLAYHLTNYVFSKKEEFPYDVNKCKINDLNKSYKLILNKSHPNFHLIDVLSDKKIIEHLNKYLLKKIKINFTFLNIVNEKNLKKRLFKRKRLNRYDKFKHTFYKKVQKGFIRQAKLKSNKYLIVNSNIKIEDNKRIIINKINKILDI